MLSCYEEILNLITFLHFVVTGHLITVDSAFLHDQKQAVLVSPVLDQQEWSCVRLVYQITGQGSLQLHLRPDRDNFDYRLWNANKSSDSWLIASVDLPNTTIPYRVGMAANQSALCLKESPFFEKCEISALFHNRTGHCRLDCWC